MEVEHVSEIFHARLVQARSNKGAFYISPVPVERIEGINRYWETNLTVGSSNFC